MEHWFCGGCSTIEFGKPHGHIHSGQYEGPQCEHCWEVECEEQAAADRLEEEGIRIDDSRNPRLGIHRDEFPVFYQPWMAAEESGV